MEEWRPVVGWEGLYEVSNLAGIRSVGRFVRYSNGRVRWYDSKPLSGCMWGDYRMVKLRKDRLQKLIAVHRIVCEAFHGTRTPPYDQVNHINGIKTDNRSANLEWVTLSGNQQHSVYVLGNRLGERNGRCKLPDDSVSQIKELYRNGLTQVQLAEMFRVSQSLISAIVIGRLRQSSRKQENVNDGGASACITNTNPVA